MLVLLTIDTLRKDVLGCYGNKHGLSPFIDSIERESIIFTKCQSIGPYTQASFPGILTSSYYLDYGLVRGCPPQRTIISEVLHEAGIVTAAFHSNPYICSFLGWNRGWDTFYDSMEEEVTEQVPYIKGDAINSNVTGWLEAHCKNDKRPFFLWVHYMDIHEPYIPERRYLDRVDPAINLTQDEMFRLFNEVLLKRDVSDKDKIALLKKLYYAHVMRS